jgi:hypothetical protein
MRGDGEVESSVLVILIGGVADLVTVICEALQMAPQQLGDL